MTTEDLLQKSIIAAETGDFGTAREILSRIVRDNPLSEWGWLALGYISPDPNMRAYCLGEVLRLNPYNKVAQDLLSEPFNPSVKALGRLTGIMKSPPNASAAKANPARTAYLPMDGDEFPSTPSIPTVEEVIQTGELKAERQKAAEEQRARVEHAPATTPQNEKPVEELDEPDWLIELEKADDHEEVAAPPSETIKPQPKVETPVVEERKSEPVLPKSPFQGIPKPRWLDESEEEEQTPEDAFSPIPPQKAAAPPSNAVPARPPMEKPAPVSPINPNTQVIPDLEEAAPAQSAAPEPPPAAEKPAPPPAAEAAQSPAAPPEPTPEPAATPTEKPKQIPAEPSAVRAEQPAQPPEPPVEKPEAAAPAQEAAPPEPPPAMPDRPKPDWMAYQEEEKPPSAAPAEALGLELPKVEFGPSAKAKPAAEDPKRSTIDMQPPGEGKSTPDWLNELDEEIRRDTTPDEEPKSSTMEIPEVAANLPKPDWLNKLEENYGIESDSFEIPGATADEPPVVLPTRPDWMDELEPSQAEEAEDMATEKVEFQKFLEMIGQSESPPAPPEDAPAKDEPPQKAPVESAAVEKAPVESKPAESTPVEPPSPAPEALEDDWLGDLENLAVQEPADSDWLDDADGHKPDQDAGLEEMHIKMDRDSSPLPNWMPKVQPQEQVEPPPLLPTQATPAETEEDSAPDWLDKIVDTPQATLNKPAAPPTPPPQQRPVTEVRRPVNTPPQPIEPPVEEASEPDWLTGFNELSAEPQVKVDQPKPDNSFAQIAEEPSKPDWLKNDFQESPPLFPSEDTGNTRMLEESGLDWLSAAKDEPKSEPPAVSDVISKPISRDRPAALEPLTPAWMNEARASSRPARRATISPSQISSTATQEKPDRRRRKKAEPKISADPARPKPRRKQNSMGMFFLGLLSGILLLLIATATALILTGDPGGTIDRFILAVTSPDAFAAAAEISETPAPTDGTPVAEVQVATRTVTPTATFTPTPTLSPTPLPLELVGPILEEAKETVYTDPQAVIEQLQPVTASITDPVDRGQVNLLLGIAYTQLEQQSQADEHYNQVLNTLGGIHTNLTDVQAIGRANEYLVAAAMALERENDVNIYNQGMIQTLSTRLDEFTTLRQFDLAYTYLDRAVTQLEAAEQDVDFDLNREILDRLPPLLEQWTSAEDLSLAYHYLMNAALNIDAQIAADDYANRMIDAITPLLDGLNSADQIGPVYLRLHDAALTLEDKEGAKAYLQDSIARMIPFQDALTDENELADLYIYLGGAESTLGTYAVAGVYYQKLIEIRYTPETIFLLASTLEQTDNKACAFKWYQILVSLKGPEIRKYRSASQEGITSINEFYEGEVPVCPQ